MPARASPEAGRATGFLVAALLAGACGAQEIAPFRIIGVEGYNTLRYTRDTLATSVPGSPGAAPVDNHRVQTEWRDELFFLAHTYVYHPNLMLLDIGLGPVLQRSSVNDNGSVTASGEVLASLSARARILRGKPVTGTLFYERLNPTVIVSPGQSLTQRNLQYGGNLSVGSPVVSMPTYIDVTHTETQGRGQDRIVDERNDQFVVRSSRRHGDAGSTQLQFQSSRQSSQGGSPSLPIVAAESTTQALSADTRLQFGDARRYELVNVVTLNRLAYAFQSQAAVAERSDQRLLLNLRARPSDELQAFGNFNHNANQQGRLDNRNQSFNAGLAWDSAGGFGANANLHFDRTRSQLVDATARGFDAGLRQRWALPLGTLQAGAGWRRDEREQTASGSRSSIIGEAQTLTATGWSALTQLRADLNSLRVVNESRSQTFREGPDYLISTVGTQVRLQRVIGGAILEGQNVLVDYEWDAGGTFAYTQDDRRVDLSWSMDSRLNVFLRRWDAVPQLRSGLPGFTLNTVHATVYGLRSEVPLGGPLDVAVGGELEWENHQETLMSFRRTSAEMHLQSADPWLGAASLRLGVRRNRVLYDAGTQNVDLRAYDLRYWGRLESGVQLSASFSAEMDAGGLVQRRRRVATLKAEWKYRKLKLSMDYGRTVETQGPVRRAPMLLQMQGRRDF